MPVEHETPEQRGQRPLRVFISYSSDARAFATELADLVSALGHHVFVDTFLAPGQSWFKALARELDSADFILLVISEGTTESRYQQQEILRGLDRTREGEGRLLPILLTRNTESIPFGLRSIRGLNAQSAKSAKDVISEIEKAILRIRKTDAPPQAVVPPELPKAALERTARRFFTEAGRRVVGADAAGRLLVPEQVWIASGVSTDEIMDFARGLQRTTVGYFCYEGRLEPDSMLALDQLRLEGNPIVPLRSNAMAAAIADGNARSMLHELGLEYAQTDNLFEARNALRDERHLFGRGELLSRVGSALARGEHILITGLRKAGKTSFLNILRQSLVAHPVVAVDFQLYDRTEEDWPTKLFSRIVAAFDAWGHREFDDWQGRPVDVKTASSLEKLLEQRRRWQIERGRDDRLVVALDELERVFPTGREGRESRRFEKAAAALRALGQGATEIRIGIVAADLRTNVNRTNTLPNGHTNPLFHLFHEVPLPLLSFEAVGDMVRALGSAMGIFKISDTFIASLYNLCGGHPSVCRLLAGAAYTRRASPERLTGADLLAGRAELDDKYVLGGFFESNFWELMTPDERRLVESAASRRAGIWGLIYPGPSLPNGETKASLISLGLLRNDELPIGAFSDWVRWHARRSKGL